MPKCAENCTAPFGMRTYSGGCIWTWRLTRLRGRTEPTSTPRYFMSGRTVRRLSSRWHRVGRRCEPDCGANHGSFPHSSPDRSWSWIKDDFRTVPRVHLGLPEGTIGDYTLVWKGADPLTRARFSFLISQNMTSGPPIYRDFARVRSYNF